MRVLLFEEQAHRAYGHFPDWVAQVAEELSTDGHEVHVLTRHGWLKGPSVDHASATYRMTRRHRALGWLGTEIRQQSWRRLGATRGRPLAFVGDSLRQIALLAAVRHRLRRLGSGGHVVVVMLSKVSPVEFSILAPRRARWVLYSLDPPRRIGGALNVRRAVGLAGRRERHRRRQGGHVQLVVNNALLGSAWREQIPWIECKVISAAGRSLAPPAPRLEARATLGLPAEGAIALFFGVVHGGKDFETLLFAFAGADPPARLVLAGTETGARFAAFRTAHPDVALPAVTVFDGRVSDDQLHLLHSAADYAVLSFFPEWPNDSGTMGDAIARGIPVCCSDTADNGRVVREYGLGELFVPGDAESLRAAAARMKDFTLDPAGQSAYLAEFSPQALSRRLLAVAAGAGAADPR